MRIIVLGMHRSGTSLACGLLKHTGVYFGEQAELIETNEENPKGFWERNDVRKLNDLLMHSMNCDWSEIPSLNPKEIPDYVRADFCSKASAVIRELEQNSPSGLIGLKRARAFKANITRSLV